MKKNRSTLKDYFKKGAIPTEANFADLIDSMLNQDEDNISKLPNDPLRVTATGADEALLNFYRVEQNEEKLTWQFKQKPDSKPGLNISDTTASRFFIENGSGNIGIGTTTPKQTLDVRGRMNIEDGVIQRGGDPITGTKDLGLYSQGEGYWIRIVTKNAPIRFFTDGGIGTKVSLSVETDKVNVNSNLQLAGNIQLDGKQKIFFSDTDTTNNLKIQLWSGYGLGINGSTLFYAANGQHSWRDSNGTNERMLLTTGADGGLTVRGTGSSSFAGSLGIGTSDVGSFKLSVNGDLRANRYVVQDSVDGGPTKGIWMWNSADSNWGIYMSTSGAKKSLAGNTATGGDGFGSHSIRVRTYSDASNGFIYENHNEQLNFSVRASNGNGYFRGALSLGNSDIYFTKTDHDHSGFGNTDGYAAIENAKNYDALMILGRAHAGGIRTVKLWDYLEVNGEFVVKAGSRTLKMQSDGNLVIYSGSKALWATGTNSSDARLKKDIRPIENALEKLLSIKGVGFSWVDELMGKGPDIGILAQDVETVFPELVSSLDQKYKSVKYLGLIPVLIEAIREMENHVLDLQTQIQALKGIG